jgi:hypothetical protein
MVASTAWRGVALWRPAGGSVLARAFVVVSATFGRLGVGYECTS